MKYGVIDIGSNSVRLLISDNGFSEKFIKTTRLAQYLNSDKVLSKEGIIKTANAVIDFYKHAQDNSVKKTFVFATEAVRSAVNKQDLLDYLSKQNIAVDIISGEDEGKIGFLGAYTDGVCAVVDVGGASSELSVGEFDNVQFSVSAKCGAVKLTELYGENEKDLRHAVKETIYVYKNVPQFDKLLAIGGTACAFASIIQRLNVYKVDLVDKYIIDTKKLSQCIKDIMNTPKNMRDSIIGLSHERQDIIVAGGIILEEIAYYLNVDKIIVRESDNLEGYLKTKLIDRQI